MQLTVVLADVVPLVSPPVFDQFRSYVFMRCTPSNSHTPLVVDVEAKVWRAEC